jgi:hypothetical protein
MFSSVKKNYIYSIILFLVILVVVLLLNKTNEEFSNYYRCDSRKISGIYKEVLDEEGANLVNKDYDLYYPCGYNNIEAQLTSLNINKNVKVFGICGCDKIASKSYLWKLLEKHYGRNEATRVMPRTFLLNNEKHKELFKTYYNPNKHYILKKNIQRKKGIKISNNLNEILNAYKHKYVLVQEMKESILINKRAMNIRLYLLVKCHGDKKEFFYHTLSKCLYADTDKTDEVDNSFNTNITNSYSTSLDIYNKNPLTFNQLLMYFDNKLNYDSNVFISNFNRLLENLCNGVKKEICNCSNLKDNEMYQLFGADILIDKNFIPYILEINKGPDMKPKDKNDKKLKHKVIYDTFEKTGVIKPNDKKYTNLYVKINA